MIRGVVAAFWWTVFLLGVASTSVRSAELTLLTIYWPPFIERNNDGQFTGAAPAIVARILQVAGVDLKPVMVPWPRLFKTIQSQANVLVFPMVRQSEREPLFNWLSPLFISDPGVLVYNLANPPPQPKTVDELRKFKLCVTFNNSFHAKLVTRGFVQDKNLFEFETLFPDRTPGAQWYIFQSQCDFKVTNWPASLALMRTRGFSDPEKYIGYYPVPENMFGDEMNAYFVASKDFDPELLKVIRSTAEKLRQSGELHAICLGQTQHDEKTCSMLKPD